MSEQFYGMGFATHKPLRPWLRGWDRAWSEVAKKFGDTACEHDGEAWQYMGTYEDRWAHGPDDVTHEFRHRALPPDGLRTMSRVPAETDDWVATREPTGDDLAAEVDF